MEVFDFLTISATIDNKIFAVHGGSTRTAAHAVRRHCRTPCAAFV